VQCGDAFIGLLIRIGASAKKHLSDTGMTRRDRLMQRCDANGFVARNSGSGNITDQKKLESIFSVRREW
jgi:hypothetical protein